MTSRTGFYRWDKDDLILSVHVQPRAKQTAVIGIQDAKLKIKLSSAPVDGQANAQLCQFVAKLFGVAKSQVILIYGQKSRDKCVCIKSPKILPEFIQNS